MVKRCATPTSLHSGRVCVGSPVPLLISEGVQSPGRYGEPIDRALQRLYALRATRCEYPRRIPSTRILVLGAPRPSEGCGTAAERAIPLELFTPLWQVPPDL